MKPVDVQAQDAEWAIWGTNVMGGKASSLILARQPLGWSPYMMGTNFLARVNEFPSSHDLLTLCSVLFCKTL